MDIDFEQIKRLREEIQEILKEKPHLQKLQDEIDRELSKCNNTHNRCTRIQEIMLEKWYEIVGASEKLNETYEEFTENKLEIVEIEMECENCALKCNEEALIEVIHVDTRQTFFVCEDCADSQFFRMVL